MKGKFIVFEGIDGCGKGTQLKLAASFIFDLNKDYDVYITREPTRDFKEIREKGYQVIIVGSTSTRIEKDLERELIKAKCKVWRKFFPNIEEIYQLADCYVFPVTTEKNAIEIPSHFENVTKSRLKCNYSESFIQRFLVWLKQRSLGVHGSPSMLPKRELFKLKGNFPKCDCKSD